MVTSSSARQLHRRVLACASDIENWLRRFPNQPTDTRFLSTLIGMTAKKLFNLNENNINFKEI